MVHSIHLTVENSLFEKLQKAKGDKSWFEFLIEPLIKEI
jgi:hypothetical protein